MKVIGLVSNRVLFINRHFKIRNILKVKQSNYLSDASMFHLRSSKYCFHYPIMIHTRNMAGHAKWQNVKHIKAEKDRQKTMMCNKYVRLVTAAIREKGPDPNMNNKLALVLEDAKKNNIPSSTLENAMKRGSNKKIKPGTLEIMGPGGSFIVIDYETDNICDFRHSLKMLCKKYGSSILSGEGRWRAVYEQKGIIKVTSLLSGENLDAEQMLDAAIEAGAEDVLRNEDETEKLIYEFISAAEDLHSVKKELEKKFLVEEAFVGYKPLTHLALSDEDMVLASKFLDELGDLPDIVRIFENLE